MYVGYICGIVQVLIIHGFVEDKVKGSSVEFTFLVIIATFLVYLINQFLNQKEINL